MTIAGLLLREKMGIMPEYRPVIIIGAARSGTKLVRDLVATHPAVDRVPYDINYIWRFGNEEYPHDELPPESLTPDTTRRIVAGLGRYQAGSPYLIEKTVSNCLRVPFVQAVFPDALFIHLLRDGRDVIESSFRQWHSRPDWLYIARKALTFPHIEAFGYARYYAGYALRRSFRRTTAIKVDTWGPRYEGIDRDLANLDLLQVCALQWKECVQKAAAGLAHLPPDRVVTIRYEEFVRRPQEHLEQIAYFVSLDPKPFTNSSEAESVTTSCIGKGRRKLSSEQLESITPLVEDTLRELSYH